jgi:hypothetical protein
MKPGSNPLQILKDIYTSTNNQSLIAHKQTKHQKPKMKKKEKKREQTRKQTTPKKKRK